MNEYEKRRKANEHFVTLKLPRQVVDRIRAEYNGSGDWTGDESLQNLILAVLAASASKETDPDQDWVVVNGYGFTHKGQIQVATLRAINQKWDGWDIGDSWEDIRNRSVDGQPFFRVRFPNQEKARVLLEQVRRSYPDAYLMGIPKRKSKRK